MPDRELTFAQAVREALAEEMRRDSRVCILGEDVAEAGTPVSVPGVKQLLRKHGYRVPGGATTNGGHATYPISSTLRSCSRIQ